MSLTGGVPRNAEGEACLSSTALEGFICKGHDSRHALAVIAYHQHPRARVTLDL